MLDDDHGISLVDQATQDRQQAPHVLEVQAGGRLVEDVDGVAGRPLRQFGRQLDPLCLAPGERRCRLTEPDVTEAHVHQGLHVPGDRGMLLEEPERLLAGHVEHVGDGAALELDVERVPVVAGPVADLAGHVHIGQEVHLDA